jgi:methionyl-tRNA synthetase
MSAGLPLPKQIFAHGWWTIEGKKMSKTLGNVIDPYSLLDEYGVDPVRYFLLREVPFGLDGDFSRQAIIGRINSDLANDLGNLFSRVIAMVHKYFQGVIPCANVHEAIDETLKDKTREVIKTVDACMNQLAFNRALASVWELIGLLNKYIDETAPWVLAKDTAKRERLATVMVSLLEALRLVSVLLAPFMPESCKIMWQAIGGEKPVTEQHLTACKEWSTVNPGTRIQKIPPLFPRIEAGSAS